MYVANYEDSYCTVCSIQRAYSGNLNEQIHYAPQESERSVFTQGIYGTFFDPGFKVQILDYYMNN